MPPYIVIIGQWVRDHGGKIVYALDIGFAGIASQWKQPVWVCFAMLVLNTLAGYNATVVQPKVEAKKLLALKRQFCTASYADIKGGNLDVGHKP
jgi:hypothetical protein